MTSDGITLTADENSAIYQWIDCDANGNFISGETNQSFTANTDGSYAVIIDNGSCIDTSLCYTISGIGIKERNNTPIKIYPNPTRGKITIEGIDIKNIIISDVSGTIIKQMVVNNKQVDLDLSQEAKGIYFLKAHTHQGINIVKFVIE